MSPVKASAVKLEYQEASMTIDAGGGVSFSEEDANQSVQDSSSAESEPEEFSKPKMLLYSSYTVKSGDTIGSLAKRYALDNGTLISVNEIKDAKTLRPGQTLLIPNQDGVVIKGKNKEKLEDIVSALKREKFENTESFHDLEKLKLEGEEYKKKYTEYKKKYTDLVASVQFVLVSSVKDVSVASIQAANEIFTDTLSRENQTLFLANAKMEIPKLKEVTGDIFLWPAYGTITDRYGYRSNPFGGVSREFHNGMDISAKTGTPVRAAMPGRVTSVVYDHPSYGNYVVLTHSNGYRTLYAHMSAIKTQSGAYVNAGELIGAVGSTGRSTGPHLHFTVYKNGTTINPRPLLR